MKEVMLAVRESPLVRFSAALSLVGWLDGEDREAAFSLVESLAAESWQDFSSLPWSVLDGAISAITAGFEHLPEMALRFQLGLLQNPDKKIRTSAIYTIDDLCREQRATAAQVAPILGTLLQDPAPEVRRWTAKTLSHFGAAARPATEPLLAALHDPNSEVRGAAAIALAKLGEQRAVTRIRELLYHDQTSFQALEALQRFGPLAADAIPDLLALIPSPTDGLEPVNLILAIGEIDNAGEASLREMAELLAGPYALTALYVLGSWGTAAQPVMAELIAALDSREEMAACNAVIALGRLGPAAATAAPRLRQLLEDKDPLLRTCSAIALWQIERSELTVPLLIGIIEQELNQHNHDLRYACSTAAEYLGEIGSEATSAAPMLRRALQHNNFRVRIHAACSLWHITRNAEEVLAIFLEELKPHGESAEIMGCLAEMGSQASAAIPELRRIIESEARVVEIASIDDWIERDEEFRELAIKTLQAILAD
jgi:HEAT repeat protein